MTEINVGRSNGNNAVELNKLKGGLKKEALKTEAEKSIFEAIDKDKNGIVDQEELSNFKESIDRNDNNTVSKREARKFLKANDLKGIKKKEALKFLEQYQLNTENVESVEVLSTDADGKKKLGIKYNDNTSEIINTDNSTEHTKVDEEGTTVVTYKNPDKVMTKQTTKDSAGNTTDTTFDADGETPLVKEEQDVSGKHSTTIFEDGKPSTKDVKEGITKSHYEYDEAGNEVLKTKVENEGIPAKEVKTEYTYNEDGTVKENITEHNKTTERVTKDGNTLAEIVQEEGKTTTTTFFEKGSKEEIVDAQGNKTVTARNLDGNRLVQQKSINGNVYTVEYDGEGNTKGIIVQNGESPEVIAKKFGCDVNDLKELNAEALKGGKKYFLVGQEIKIPGELEADDKALQGRKSAAETKAD